MLTWKTKQLKVFVKFCFFILLTLTCVSVMLCMVTTLMTTLGDNDNLYSHLNQYIQQLHTVWSREKHLYSTWTCSLFTELPTFAAIYTTGADFGENTHFRPINAKLQTPISQQPQGLGHQIKHQIKRLSEGYRLHIIHA